MPADFFFFWGGGGDTPVSRGRGIDSPFRKAGRDDGLERIERGAVAQRHEAVPLLRADRPNEAVDADVRDLSCLVVLQKCRHRARGCCPLRR